MPHSIPAPIQYVLPSLVLFVLALPWTRGYFESTALHWLYLLLFSFFISFAATPLVRFLAIRLNVVDEPDPRKVHTHPTPLWGGLAVFAAFALTVLYNFHFSESLKGIAVGGALIMLAGLVDDTWGLSAKARLLAQLVAVSIVCWHGVVLSFLPDAWYFTFFEILVTFIWIVGITNSMNFLDGMDGLAAGLTIIASFCISIVAIQSGQDFVMFLSVALLGSSLGFLPFNFRPGKSATIFLGDAGSNFMGFMLGSATVMTGWATNDPVKAYSMPALILGILIFDMTYITVSRFATGKVTNFREWVSYVGKDHLHHRLNNLGLNNTQAVLFIYFLALALGIGAIVLKNGRTIDGLLLIVQAFIIFLILVILMQKGAQGAEDLHYKIRSSITSILGFTKLIQETGGERMDQKREEEFLDIIQSEGENIKKLLSDLTDLSKFLHGEETGTKKALGEVTRTISGTVLVVDDDDHIRRLVEMSIHRNFKVLFAKNGAECLETVRRERPDVILMDLFMPEMNGLDAAKILRKEPNLKKIQIIIQTAKNLNPKEVKEVLQYADHILSKPFSPGELLATINKLFQDGAGSEKKPGG